MQRDFLTYQQSSYTIEDVKRKEQMLQREINLARTIQTTLLNGHAPSIEGGEVFGYSIPARLIGGDYYDFYPLVNGKVRIVIGDVMGKGIPAAMLMILTRGAFRTAAESTQSPGKTLTAMNKALYNDLRKLKSFVTVFCADWDPLSGTFTYANAGHHLPLFIRGDAVHELPKVKGIMIGGLPNQIYHEESIQLFEHDSIFFYTDGIIEAQNKRGEQFTLARLIETLKQNQDKNAGEIEKKVLESIHKFTEGVPQKDDMTMVFLKVGKQKVDISSLNSPVM
ncbi:MAG: serine/threonine protein phosphatase [Bacillaceae bacterium]|jgi:Serine phosphatase RsbU, regulator of sigma subunit|nr:MAG: serine/threonine protein phosphatase [Bacillaceae bacterium]RZI51761.1 serine/threonine-protein phosphatase [Aeribacillus pallidus]TVZ86933.1 sigma-B regulation protein RsbU (phosphoserine phosphatase) [Aeribacillus composti]